MPDAGEMMQEGVLDCGVWDFVELGDLWFEEGRRIVGLEGAFI